jgi:hypothetical protein
VLTVRKQRIVEGVNMVSNIRSQVQKPQGGIVKKKLLSNF